MNSRTYTPEACCTTPAAMRYWTIIFVAALVPLIAIAVYWPPLSGAAGPLAAGTACFGNWRRNRTYHCGITGPIFLLAGAVLLLAGAGLIHVRPLFVWLPVGVGVVGALYLEWRYAKRPRQARK